MYSRSSLATWNSVQAKYGGKFTWPWQWPGGIVELFKPQAKVEEEQTGWLKKLEESSGTPPVTKPQGKKFPILPVAIIGTSAAVLFFYYRRQQKKGKTFMQSVLPFIDLKKA